MKKITLCLVTLVVLFCSQDLTVLAAGDNVDETIGYVTRVDGGKIYISGEAITSDGLPDVVVDLGDAPIYDLLTGLPMLAHEINADMGIRAAYGAAAEGKPRPAVVVWMNWDYDNAAVFTVVVSENVHYGTDGVVFLSADGKYRVALTPEIVILDDRHNELYPSDIKPGMEFFVWVDMITASNPALVYPDKVVLISN